MRCWVCISSAISVHQTLEPSVQGKASFQLVAEYYNRNLSGWEPFLEPWRSDTAPAAPLACTLEQLGLLDSFSFPQSMVLPVQKVVLGAFGVVKVLSNFVELDLFVLVLMTMSLKVTGAAER